MRTKRTKCTKSIKAYHPLLEIWRVLCVRPCCGGGGGGFLQRNELLTRTPTVFLALEPYTKYEWEVELNAEITNPDCQRLTAWGEK